MRIPHEVTRQQGGVVTRRQLLRWGNGAEQIRSWLSGGGGEVLRPGWYASAGADPEVVAAVRSGGVLGCCSALTRLGVFSLDRRLHIRSGPAGLRRLPPGAVRCRLGTTRQVPRNPVDDLPTALVCSSRCCSEEDFLVLLDSVVNLGLMAPDEIERLFATASSRVRGVLARMDAAESGTETLVRSRLRRRGLRVRSQVVIPGVGRVDLVVGDSLVIECDSVDHHTGLEAYRRDRERDRKLRAIGYVTIRLTYHQVVFDWASVEADIVAIVRRGEHRRRVTSQ